jgi:putative glutamine amidotransferase
VIKPLIGIAASTRTDPETGNIYNAAYAPNVKAVERAGGLPLLIPCYVNDETLRAIYETLDGVLLPGGGDVEPHLYNETLHPKANSFDPDRDRIELLLTRWAVDDNRPLFGICRGHQVINVALGGTLYQDIPSQFEDPLEHTQYPGLARKERSHPVQIEADSHLARILGTTNVPVNSLHHQSVKDVAPALVVTAHAGDGIVEAAEIPNNRFALTVQWHPEDLAPDDPMMQKLFDEFVKAAAEIAAAKRG